MPRATAFLLAAGFGTRLRPLTLDRPKPLLPICGVPMLDHALELVRRHGHEHVLVNAHWLWEQVARWAVQRGVELQVEHPEILGTGGGLRAAAERLASRFVVVNGDILCDIDLDALIATVPDGGAAMALRADTELGQSAPVEQTPDGIVVRMRDFAGTPGVGVPGTHFTGVHAADRSFLECVPDGPQCIVRTAYKDLLPDGSVRGIVHDGVWFDIGTPQQYLSANLDVLDGKISPPVDVWAHGARTNTGAWVGSNAVVEGLVNRSVIGDNARVPADARLDRCVVWDGVTVPGGDYQDVVFHDRGLLQVAPA